MVAIDPHDATAVINRLRRAQGQLGGIIGMLEEGRDCAEVATQLAAVSKAVDRTAYLLIANALRQCLTAGDEGTVDLQRLEKAFLSFA